MTHSRYAAHVGERGRVVLPAELRRRLDVKRGDLLVFDLETEDETLQVRKAVDVARDARGLFRDLAPGTDLAAELIRERRAEAERENTASALERR